MSVRPFVLTAVEKMKLLAFYTNFMTNFVHPSIHYENYDRDRIDLY